TPPDSAPPRPALAWASSLRLASMHGLLLSGGEHHQAMTVRPGDTLSALFARAKLPATDWRQLLQLGGKTAVLRTLHPGDTLRYSRTADGHLATLSYHFRPAQRLHVERSAQKFDYSFSHDATPVRTFTCPG